MYHSILCVIITRGLNLFHRLFVLVLFVSDVLSVLCQYFTCCLFFLKTASGFKGKCGSEFVFPTSNLDVAYNFGYFRSKSANFSKSFSVIWEC